MLRNTTQRNGALFLRRAYSNYVSHAHVSRRSLHEDATHSFVAFTHAVDPRLGIDMTHAPGYELAADDEPPLVGHQKLADFALRHARLATSSHTDIDNNPGYIWVGHVLYPSGVAPDGESAFSWAAQEEEYEEDEDEDEDDGKGQETIVKKAKVLAEQDSVDKNVDLAAEIKSKIKEQLKRHEQKEGKEDVDVDADALAAKAKTNVKSEAKTKVEAKAAENENKTNEETQAQGEKEDSSESTNDTDVAAKDTQKGSGNGMEARRRFTGGQARRIRKQRERNHTIRVRRVKKPRPMRKPQNDIPPEDQ